MGFAGRQNGRGLIFLSYSVFLSSNQAVAWTCKAQCLWGNPPFSSWLNISAGARGESERKVAPCRGTASYIGPFAWLRSTDEEPLAGRMMQCNVVQAAAGFSYQGFAERRL